MPQLVEIGFWRTLDGLNPHLPDASSAQIRQTPPRPSFVDSLLPNHNRARCVVHSIELGASRCRICGKPNGCANLTNGVYIWPEVRDEMGGDLGEVGRKLTRT
jgi:hypothetical protein